MNEIAKDFLSRSFRSEETVAILLRDGEAGKTQQRILQLNRVLSPAFGRWLAHENHNGTNVYVAANPLVPGSRRRTKECIASVRHLYLDIDVDGDAHIAALRASDLVPMPNVVVATSSGKFQVLWQVAGFNFYMQETILKLLALAFHGDIACTDCNRVLRIPGFLNCKYEPAQLVTVEYLSDETYFPEDFRLYADHEVAIDSAPKSRRTPSQTLTHSEKDWAFVLRKLERGRDVTKLTVDLAAARGDKPNPIYYAQRTVDMASARLALLHGDSIDDVVAMLIERRRDDLPLSLAPLVRGRL